MAVIGNIFAVIAILFVLAIGAVWLNYKEHEIKRRQRKKKDD